MTTRVITSAISFTHDVLRSHSTTAMAALSEAARLHEDLDQALVHAQKALACREAVGFKPYQPFDHVALANLYGKTGDVAKAQVHLRQATTLAEAMGLSSLIARLVTATNRLDTPAEGA